MYANSTAFKTAMAQPSRTLTCRGTLLSPAGVITNLPAVQIVGWQVDESCADAGLPLGTVRAAKVTLRLDNSGKAWLGVSLDGYLLTLEQGVLDGATYRYAPIGQYVIESGRAQEQDTVAIYTGSDRMAGTMLKPFSDNVGNYPRTLLQMAQAVASQAQITLGTTSFTNSGVTIPSMPAWPEGVTRRDVIGYIACIASGFARIGRTGNLEIISIAVAVAATIGPDRYKTLDKPGNTFGPLNTIFVSGYGAPEGTSANRYAVNPGIVDNSANSIQIGNNPLLAHGSSTLATLTSNMLSALGGLEVSATTVSWQGDPSWECGDRVQVIDLQGNPVKTIITKQVLTYGTGFGMLSSCVIDGVTKADSRNRSTKVFTPDGNVNAARVIGPMDLMRVWMRASDSFVDAEIINGKGTLRENTNPESPYYGATYEGAGFIAFSNQKDGEGNWIWRIGLTPRGIAGDQVFIETEHGVYLSASGAVQELAEGVGAVSDSLDALADQVDGKSTIYFGATEPPQKATGDFWYKNNVNPVIVYRWSGSAWVNVTTTVLSAALQAAASAQSTADGKIRTFAQTTAPTGMTAADVGDLWFDTANNNKVSRWSGTAWQLYQDTHNDAAVTAHANSIAALNTAVGGKTTIFYQPGQPTATATGDVWYDTDASPVTIKRWSGSAWVDITTVALAQALSAAGTAQATADGKVRTFAQIDAPTGMTATDAGDLWIDTNDSNKLYRWSGSAWVAVQDTHNDAALEQVQTDVITNLGLTSEAINASAARITTIESALPGMATKTEVNAQFAVAQLDVNGLFVRVGTAEGKVSGLESDATNLKSFKNVQETVFKVTPEGAVVGQTGVPTSVLVAANRVAIRDQYNNEVTKITDNKMEIENADIRKQMTVGFVARTKLADGSCGDKWIG